jgi:hypothetical protein
VSVVVALAPAPGYMAPRGVSTPARHGTDWRPPGRHQAASHRTPHGTSSADPRSPHVMSARHRSAPGGEPAAPLTSSRPSTTAPPLEPGRHRNAHLATSGAADPALAAGAPSDHRAERSPVLDRAALGRPLRGSTTWRTPVVWRASSTPSCAVLVDPIHPSQPTLESEPP